MIRRRDDAESRLREVAVRIGALIPMGDCKHCGNPRLILPSHGAGGRPTVCAVCDHALEFPRCR